MKKNINIEILRCVAITAVVIIHTSVPYFYNQDLMNNDILSWGIINFYYAMSRFCVPMFFLISAYLYFKNNQSYFLMKRVKRILLPYFIWSIIYWWFNEQHTINSFFIKIFCETSSYHLWFLVVFFGYSILLPIMMSFSKMPNKEVYKPVIVLVFIFSFCLPPFYQLLSNFGVQIKHISSFYLEIPQFFVYALALPFILKKTNVVYSILLYLSLVLINMLINMITAYHLGRPDEYWYLYTGCFVFLSSLIVFNLFINADFSFIKNRSAWLVYKIGECSFGIYLCHLLVIRFLTNMGFLMVNYPIIAPIINTVIVMVTSFLICLGCRHIKYLKEIF